MDQNGQSRMSDDESSVHTDYTTQYKCNDSSSSLVGGQKNEFSTKRMKLNET